MLLKQSTARNRMILMVDSTDHITGKTGLTLTITASKDGGAFSSITPTVTERGTGWYSLALTASHTDTLGDLAIHITGTAADATDIADQVVTDLPGSSVSSVTGSVIVGTNNDKTGYRLSATGVDDILDDPVEGTTTLRQMLRGYASALFAKLSGAGTATVTIRDIADTKDRITATVDSSGNRTSVTTDLT